MSINAIISGTGCISNPTTYHEIHKENHMTSKIVTPTTEQIRDWATDHPDTFGRNVDLVLVLLDRIERIEKQRDSAVNGRREFRRIYMALRSALKPLCGRWRKRSPEDGRLFSGRNCSEELTKIIDGLS